MGKLHRSPVSCAVCQTAQDVAFIVDESLSVTPSGFRLQTNFIHEFAQQYRSVVGRLHVGLIRYSNTARVSFNFSAYTNIPALLTTINSLLYNGSQSSRNIAAALQLAAQSLFVQGGGVRPLNSSSRLCLLIAGGKSDIGPDPQAEADALRRLGVRVSVVNVGSAISMQGVQQIASVPTSINVFQLPRFEEFQSILGNVNTAACEG